MGHPVVAGERLSKLQLDQLPAVVLLRHNELRRSE